MTEQSYLEDSSVRRFEATVERSLSDPPRVVLDRTQFYPEGGGQPADHGTLTAAGETWNVTNVQKRDTIYHELDGEAPPGGTRVTGDLDWERREAHMRYHTAQHLLSALLLAAYDAPTRGNQLYADRARIDVEHGRFDEDDLATIEARMNDLVDDGRPVRWYTMGREAAEARLDTDRTRIDLLPDSITELRIVEVGAPGEEPRGQVDGPGEGDVYDRTACAGTHVTDTAAVGTVSVTGRETGGSDRERLHFELE
ncbi:alanyl-tRNA editing protein [Salinirubellus salinus]|uniref:Alanyl-tRNA editing protein n=1 Tax=Salinirubellus salinus TaxID=1364945 RepID=A0A9E7R6E8_9EURY|nr:alanyl-tRNA editing protein [Salinirubellus salinus]UWM55553.1 alanyl-tRNA editing protein [Salinirubellus salinus]